MLLLQGCGSSISDEVHGTARSRNWEAGFPRQVACRSRGRWLLRNYASRSTLRAEDDSLGELRQLGIPLSLQTSKTMFVEAELTPAVWHRVARGVAPVTALGDRAAQPKEFFVWRRFTRRTSCAQAPEDCWNETLGAAPRTAPPWPTPFQASPPERLFHKTRGRIKIIGQLNYRAPSTGECENHLDTDLRSFGFCLTECVQSIDTTRASTSVDQLGISHTSTLTTRRGLLPPT